MFSEAFLYEYIRNTNKFRPSFPIPFQSVGVFYDIYLEELMDWILKFYREARSVNPYYGGANADSSEFVGGDANYEPHFDLYFSEDLFGNFVPEDATEIATIYIPEMGWYNPTPRTLDIRALQGDEDAKIYTLPYEPRISEEETPEGEFVEVEREPCQGITRTDIRFLRLYVYDIARELVNAIDYLPVNVALRPADLAPEDIIQPEYNAPKFIPSGRNIPVDLDVQSLRPYLGFTLAAEGAASGQHLMFVNLIELCNSKELDRSCYYGVYDILDMDGLKFPFTKVHYDQYQHFLFVGEEDSGILITNTSLTPLIKLKSINETDEPYWKIVFYLGVGNIRFLRSDGMTYKIAHLPDYEMNASFTPSYTEFSVDDYRNFKYNDSAIGGNVDYLDYIYDHYVLSETISVNTNCSTFDSTSVGGFTGKFNEDGLNGLWSVPHLLVDERFDIHCFKAVTGTPDCVVSSEVYGYDFALIGHLRNPDDRRRDAGGEELPEPETPEEIEEAERVAREKEDKFPFTTLREPWNLNVLEDTARITAYQTIHPDPRRIHLWMYSHRNPPACYGFQEIIYGSSSANFEYDRRIATNFDPSQKHLVIIGDPYESRSAWKTALANWNAGARDEITILEEGLKLCFNGILTEEEPMEWSIQNAGMARNFARLLVDPDGDGHTKLLSVVNFHDPIFIKVRDSYRMANCISQTGVLYVDLPRRERSLMVKVWPRTIPCVQHLQNYFLDEAHTFNFEGNNKSLDQYPLWGPFPAFYVSGLLSNLDAQVEDDGDEDEYSAYLDMFVNGFDPVVEFQPTSFGLLNGLDSGIKTDFDGSVAYDKPLRHMTINTYKEFTTEDTPQWILYMWGKTYGISTLSLRDWDEYHQDSFFPELAITQRDNLLGIEVFVWTVDGIPETVNKSEDIPQQFTLQIKGIVSHPLLWTTSDNSIATIAEDLGSGSASEDDAPTTAVVSEVSRQDQMDNGGPTATLTVKKAGTFRVVVMDSARIPFVSHLVTVKTGGDTVTTEVVVEV